MPRRLPPLNALRSFEAAARYESFTRAANELHVTQSAVSQQVKALEAQLGLKLFNRERQRLKITPAGRDYLVEIREALDHVGAATADTAAQCGSPHGQHLAGFRGEMVGTSAGTFRRGASRHRPAGFGDDAQRRFRP